MTEPKFRFALVVRQARSGLLREVSLSPKVHEFLKNFTPQPYGSSHLQYLTLSWSLKVMSLACYTCLAVYEDRF